MTKDDIMRWALESGGLPDPMVFYAGYERFANLVAAHKAEVALAEAYRCGYEAGAVAEREVCAKLCESRQTPGTGSVAILNGAADAIRARTTP